MAKKDNINLNIKTSYVVFAVVAIAFFLIGFFSSKMISGVPGSLAGTNKEDCVTYCNLASASFNSVKDGHCYCDQERPLYDSDKNRTLMITQTLDAGIIKNIEVQPGLPQEAVGRIT